MKLVIACQDKLGHPLLVLVILEGHKKELDDEFDSGHFNLARRLLDDTGDFETDPVVMFDSEDHATLIERAEELCSCTITLTDTHELVVKRKWPKQP